VSIRNTKIGKWIAKILAMGLQRLMTIFMQHQEKYNANCCRTVGIASGSMQDEVEEQVASMAKNKSVDHTGIPGRCRSMPPTT
jgi:hypothetical protein